MFHRVEKNLEISGLAFDLLALIFGKADFCKKGFG
jgi:predicted lipid carrier protein YhbT